MLLINEFLKNIEIYDSTKERLREIWKEIDEYIDRLSCYSVDAQNIFLEDYLIKEIVASDNIENELYSSSIIKLYNSDFFMQNKIDSNFLKMLNKAVRENDKILTKDEFERIRKEKNKDITYSEYLENIKNDLEGNFRTEMVWIGNGNEGIENAFHVPPKPEEIQGYINDFLEFYNNDSNNENLNDPIVKAALIHIILIKIHPFANGNGRVARLLLNRYLTSKINQKNNTSNYYPYINLSKSFDLSRLSYFKKQNDIIFKEDVDNNDAINNWIKYNIIAIEEQLYFLNSRLDNYEPLLMSDDKIYHM